MSKYGPRIPVTIETYKQLLEWGLVSPPSKKEQARIRRENKKMAKLLMQEPEKNEFYGLATTLTDEAPHE